MKRVGDRDHETFTKKCEEQPRESFALRIIEKKCQRLEKEENDTTNLCENHECYEWKWAGEHINMKCMTNCEEPSLFRKLEIDKLEHDYNLQTSKYKSNTDSTLNVDMWDNTMKVKSDETDNNTFDLITLDKNLQTAKIEGNKTIVNNLIYNRIDDKII